MTSDIKIFNLHNVFQTANLVGIVWNLDKEIKSRVLYYASCMAYIFHILYKTNYRTIIKENNKLISFLAANVYGKSNYFKYLYLFLCFISIFIMLFYKDGRSILNYQLAYNKLLDEMKNENNSNYDAELVLFITNPLYQGKGYGKALLNNFHSYMQSKKKYNIYLFTDDYCDYKMYEKAGCIKINEKSGEFYFLAGEKFRQELYMYAYKIN